MVLVRSVRMVISTAPAAGLKLGKQPLDAVRDQDNVGPGLALNVHNHRGYGVHPGRLPDVLGAVIHVGDVGQRTGAPL